MPSTSDYLTQLQTDKTNLVSNLNTMGVEASASETFTSLAPKVLDIQSGIEINGTEETNIANGNINVGDFVTHSNTKNITNVSTRAGSIMCGCIELEDDVVLNVYYSTTTTLGYSVIQLSNNAVITKKSATTLYTVEDKTISSTRPYLYKISNNRVLVAFNDSLYNTNILLCDIDNEYSLTITSELQYSPLETSHIYVRDICKLSSNSNEYLVSSSYGASGQPVYFYFITIENNTLKLKENVLINCGELITNFYYFFKTIELDKNQAIIFYAQGTSSSGYVYARKITVSSDLTSITLGDIINLSYTGYSTWGLGHMFPCLIANDLIFVGIYNGGGNSRQAIAILEVSCENDVYNISKKYHQMVTILPSRTYSYSTSNGNDYSWYLLYSTTTSSSNGGVHNLSKIMYDEENNSFKNYTISVNHGTYYNVNQSCLALKSGKILINGSNTNTTSGILYQGFVDGIGDYVIKITSGSAYGVALESKNSGENIKVIKP